MDLLGWAFYAFITAIALTAVVLQYRMREPAGRGRGLLMALRGATLALLILLLFDPLVPVAAGGTGSRGTLVLLDGSLSMRLPAGTDESRWEAGRRIADEVEAGRVMTFGGGVESAGADNASAAPDGTDSRLEPAIRAAAEAGATRVVVVTDGGVEDATAALGLARRTGLGVEFRRVEGGAAANAGIAEVEAPSWMRVGEETAVEASVAAIGDVGDSLTLVLRRGGRELARTRVEAPGEGRLASATLRFAPVAASPDPVRLEVALEGGDAAPDDDVRPLYVRISEDPAGVALVTFRPDQEPRFLLPVLERALGVPVRGWMALPEGRYIRLGAGSEAGMASGEREVRGAIADADLLVLHGTGAGMPAWAREAAGRAERLLVFPAGLVPGASFAPGPAQPGDWYPAAEVPASPVASLLAGIEPGDAPPLQALRTGAPPQGWWAPMDARLGRRGEPLPVVVAGSVGDRRVAVAMGDGYWRWAFDSGSGRELYDRLWSALAGWLMAETGSVLANAVEPVDRVVPRGAPVRFRVPGGADSVAVRIAAATTEGSEGIEGESDDAVLDRTVSISSGVAVVGVLPPGRYRYTARPFVDGARAESEAVGELTVERYSPEFTRMAVALDETDVAGGAGQRESTTRPLRASAWPYALLVLLLCAEWVLRRRWGLR